MSELREGDRAVWISIEEGKAGPVGSSGKVLSIEDGQAEVNWGGGKTGTYEIGTEVVDAEEAARRGIDPWAQAFRGSSVL